MTALIGRREFMTLLGGGIAAWPLAAPGAAGDKYEADCGNPSDCFAPDHERKKCATI